MSDKPHIVINQDRSITIPQELTQVAVQYDHNIETVTFDCPRYFEGTDLFNMSIYINYKYSNDKQDSFLAQNITVDETDENIIHFDWTITQRVTSDKGAFTFSICAKTADSDGNVTKHWNSVPITKMTVAEGLETEEVIVEQNPDIILALQNQMSDVQALIGDVDTALDDLISYQNSILNSEGDA